jgi:predicted phosphodiesterase
MTYAVISDIHSNLEALTAVFAEIDRRAVDSVVCLGDLVGYNADPDACARLVAARCSVVIRGNHDKAAADLMDLDWFNTAAKAAALWTRRTMGADALEGVRRLPQGPVELPEGVLICHGSPVDEDEYLLPGASIGEAIQFLDEEYPGARICLHGHTHRPLAASRAEKDGPIRVQNRLDRIDIARGGITLLNPGSVGQPRDGNSMASFGILDAGRMTFTIVRVVYAISETQRKILAAGLPPELARRLGEGW